MLCDPGSDSRLLARGTEIRRANIVNGMARKKGGKQMERNRRCRLAFSHLNFANFDPKIVRYGASSVCNGYLFLKSFFFFEMVGGGYTAERPSSCFDVSRASMRYYYYHRYLNMPSHSFLFLEDDEIIARSQLFFSRTKQSIARHGGACSK